MPTQDDLRLGRATLDETASTTDELSDKGSQPVDVSDEETTAAPWRALFFFTTRANVPMLVLGILFALVAGVASPAQNFVIGKVFDGFTSYAGGTLSAAQFIEQETKYVLYLVAIAGGSWLFHFLFFTTWLVFGELQGKSARDRLFHGLLEKNIEWYDMRKHGIGALLPRLQTQIRELQLATSQPLGELFTNTATAVSSLALAFFYSWQLTLVTLSTVPVIMAVVVWLGAGTQSHIARQDEKLTEAQKYITGALSAIETVKCFNGQSFELARFTARIRQAAGSYYRVANANALQMAFIVLLTTSVFVQGFYYGGVLIAAGTKTSAQVITTFLSAVGTFQSIQGIIPQMIVMEKGRGAGATLRAIMAQVKQGSTVKVARDLLSPERCEGNIDVKKVSFAYPSRPDQMALKNVTMFIPGGEMTFLIGKSGSGKSTLGQLLMGFYPCAYGSITLDQKPLSSLDVVWLRRNITLVEQQTLLFNDTVFRNIALGTKDQQRVTKQEVMDAAEFALLQLMISDMPDGLDTMVGLKGGSMSGGQRQRMALARARLRDTPILVLDESTSALDQISRALMMDAIRIWRRGKTTIVITHDISQILSDDYVYLLEHGTLVQEGYRKHMEKVKDTPFQGFLSEEQRAAVSLFDSRKGTDFESMQTQNLSLGSLALHTWPPDLARDPLEAQLEAGEANRQSFVTAAFTHSNPMPGIGAFGVGGPTSAFAFPFLRMALSSPSDSPRSSQRWSGTGPRKDGKPPPLDREENNRSNRWSQALAELMERYLDKTGNVAAKSRLRSFNLRRRRSRSPAGPTDHPRFHPGQMNSEADLNAIDRNVDARDAKSMKDILATLWPNIDWFTRMMVILGFYGATIHAVASPVFSYILSMLLQTYADPTDRQRKSLLYSMLILAVSIIDAIHTYMLRMLLEYAAQRWVDNIRHLALKRILDQPRDFFSCDENAASRLTESLDRNAEEMRNILGRFLGLLYVAALMCTVSIVWALVAQWKMTLIALSVAPYIFCVTKAFAAVSDRWEGLSNDASEAAAATFTEVFTNIKTVRALTVEDHFLEKYKKATNHALVVGLQRSFYSGFFYGLSDSAGNFAIALVFYVGAKLVHTGVSVMHVIEAITLLIITITNVAGILACVPQLGSAKDTASRLLRLSQLPQDSHEHLGDTRITSVGDIVLTNLRFSYPSRPDQTILRNVNLCISPGISTAIVGSSGSGKSTIASLLLNLYSTATIPAETSGTLADLTIASRDMKHIYTPSLRSLVTVVAQTPTLFSATIAENITYGLSDSSPLNKPASVREAAALAGIHEFIASLPLGYNTLVGEGGTTLSGGQAQRVAIARALVRKPSVLILDEATSALDVESAGLVRQTIKDLVKDRKHAMTVIIITHSRDMMTIAEKIVVLDQGRVMEEGGFDDLMMKGGELFNLLNGGEWTGEQDRANETAGKRGAPSLREINWRNKKASNARRLL